MVQVFLVFSLPVALCKVFNKPDSMLCICVCVCARVQVEDRHNRVPCWDGTWPLPPPYSAPSSVLHSFLPPLESARHHLTDRQQLPKQSVSVSRFLSDFTVLLTSSWEISKSPARRLPPGLSVMSNPPQEKTITVQKLICPGRPMSNFSAFEVWLPAVNRIRKQGRGEVSRGAEIRTCAPWCQRLAPLCWAFSLPVCMHAFYGCRCSLIYF